MAGKYGSRNSQGNHAVAKDDPLAISLLKEEHHIFRKLFDDSSLLKNIDAASPHLIEFVATGKHIPTGVLSFRSASGKDTNAPYYTVTLNDILVSSIDQTDNPDPGKIVEKVTLSAAKFRFEYRPQNADGSLGAAVDFGFDCRTNTKF